MTVQVASIIAQLRPFFLLSMISSFLFDVSVLEFLLAAWLYDVQLRRNYTAISKIRNLCVEALH